MSGGDVQMPAANGTLNSMKWLGYTRTTSEYLANHAPVHRGPWRHGGNGNPDGMLDIVRSVLPQCKVAFLVQRDLNRNVVVYAVNELRPGVPDPAKPLTAFWLMIPGPHHRSSDDEVDLGEVYTEDLNTLERTLAYGVSAAEVKPDRRIQAKVRAVSGEAIDICYDADEQQWTAFVTIHQFTVQLTQFFIHTEPRQWAPWPKSVELHIHVTTTSAGESVVYHYEV